MTYDKESHPMMITLYNNRLVSEGRAAANRKPELKQAGAKVVQALMHVTCLERLISSIVSLLSKKANQNKYGQKREKLGK